MKSDALFRIFNDIWNSLPNSSFESLVAFMPDLATIVRENKGVVPSTDSVVRGGRKVIKGFKMNIF